MEGAIVGLISALCAWGLSYLAYSELFKRAMTNVEAGSLYALLPMGSLSLYVLFLCLASGIIIGSIGSGIAVRKYVKV